MDNKEQEEMNIFQVIARMGRAIGDFFCAFLGIFGKIAQLAYKYKYLFLVCVAVIVAASVYQRRDKAKMYRAEMHLLLNDGELFMYDNLLKQLSQYPMRHDTEGLAAALNVSSEVASKIYGFETFHVIDINRDSIMDFVDYKHDILLGDTVNVIVPNQMVIRAKLNSEECCEDVQNALLSYFANNNYLASLNISRLTSLEDREWMFRNALLNLDSLQKVEYFKQTPAYSLEFASAKNESQPFVKAKRQLYYNDMKNLFDINEKIAVDMSTNLEVVTVLSDLQLEYKLENPTWKIVLITSLIGLFIFSLIACILDNRESIVKYLKNEK